MNEIFKSMFPKLYFSVDGVQGGGAPAVEDDTDDDGGDKPEIIEVDGKKILKSDLEALEVGADGISRANNKAIETERKLKELEEKLALAKDLAQTRNQPEPPKAPDLKSISTAAKETYKQRFPNMDDEQLDATIQIATEMAAGFTSAQAQARAPIDAEYFVDKAKSTIKDSDDRSVMEKWEDEVNEALEQMPTAWKTTPQNAKQAVRNALDVVKGRHVKELVTIKNPMRPRETGNLGGGNKETPVKKESKASEAQKSDMAGMPNVSEAEYKYLLEKAQARDKAAGRAIRQTLN